MFGTVNSFGKPAQISCLFLAILLSSCSSKDDTKECFYEIYDTHAQVSAIVADTEHTGRMLVKLEFMASGLAFETQEMGAIKGIEIDQDFVDRNRIKVGNKYEVKVSELTQGNCTPRFVTFNHTLE